ncbi:hypothetical protein [Rufibacter quisquiliarum]|uniref:Glycosyltransferase RgtA/B/C/D-like domain-containing protein n=1 Tax=Rufibacter quisquiliarum TaxID=1549639 RepID=A0A839GQ29_9BACT|nr:hypothetical protein [Rufibacter quisquiliarum]MBA9076986.1 hypothetical protein [Rufibacter quisquiliarum]
MEAKDLFITPIFLIIIYSIAFQIKGRLKDKQTKKYFIPALTLKIIGAIGMGLIYQFYYSNGVGRGDTFSYWRHANLVYEAFGESFSIGWKLLTSTGQYDPETFKYASQMRWYKAADTFFVVRVATIFGLFCFQAYSTIAIFFAIFSFSGVFALYTTLLKIFPKYQKEFAISCFFIPSFFFWGSGIMKDTICVGMLGWAFWAFYQGFVEKRKVITSILILFISLWIIQIVKTYILLCFVPAVALWVFMENSKKIKNRTVRMLSKPILIGFGAVAGYLGSTQLTADSDKYSIDNIAETAAVTSDYLERQTERSAGSTGRGLSGRSTGSSYNVGKLDGSVGSMVSAAPQAIFVTLYRPFIFEVRNPIMLLSALESTWFIVLTFTMFRKNGFARTFRIIFKNPFLTFCILFSLMFSIGVGLTSGNFGTLVRYKIPLLPFFLSLLLLLNRVNKPNKTKNAKVQVLVPRKY